MGLAFESPRTFFSVFVVPTFQLDNRCEIDRNLRTVIAVDEASSQMYGGARPGSIPLVPFIILVATVCL